MRSVEAVMREVAQSEVPVLLLAENGAGKKATARRIHELSRRKREKSSLFFLRERKGNRVWKSGRS